MKCPFCGHADDRVLDTRVQKDGSIRRRRECLECKARFSTVETIMLALPYIIKKDGRREPFSKEKILKGLSAATQKRPVSVAQVEAVVERISAWIINRGESEVSSRLLGKKVMAELKQLDDVAYIRFASVYRTFKDVQEFVETLEDAELLDFVDANNPQLSLTAMNFVESEKKPNHETDSKTTITRTRTPDPIPN
ncbi:MAG: transcriptional repressor NrdR [Bdellovibrio sp.]|jgi:transcriptional repressor NrdR|nr:transcriptional repressor NrdR [Bdellovibrio sp.]